jgi:hypothetical protein
MPDIGQILAFRLSTPSGGPSIYCAKKEPVKISARVIARWSFFTRDTLTICWTTVGPPAAGRTPQLA